MPLSTLTPKIRVCISNDNTTLKVYDTTQAYNVASNVGGWGATNLVATAITSAKITYVTPDGTSTAADVLTQVTDQDPVTDELLLG